MDDKERPAEPDAGDNGGAQRGGFAKVAKHLNELHPERRRPISRQLVHKWWLSRRSNRFPEAVETTGSSNGGRGNHIFDFAAVAVWYAEYRRTRQYEPRSEQRSKTVIPPPAGDGAPSVDDGTLAA